MSAATATIRTFFPELNLRKSISCLEFPTSKLIFSGKCVSWKSVPWENRAWSPKTMAESIFRVECVRGLEQEAFIDGSSDFRSNLAAVGLESTLNRLSKWLVVALFGTVILCRHDAEALWAAFGAVINAGLSVILKQILNQERPCSTLRSDPGMPSSHAQSIFFTAVFTILSMVEWLGVNGLATTLIGLILAIGSYLSWLRVSQQFHTISQVAVGAVVGSIFSILWFWSWDAIVMNAFFSYLWVAIVVVLGAAGFWLGFLFYIISGGMAWGEWTYNNSYWADLNNWFLSSPLLCCLDKQSWLRVSQQFHTISQVAVGAVVGSIFSILWFWSWDAIVMNAFFSYLWVAIVVVLGAAGFWLGFLFYIIRTLVIMLEDQ